MISEGRAYSIESADQEHFTVSEERVTGSAPFTCALYRNRKSTSVDEPCCTNERQM